MKFKLYYSVIVLFVFFLFVVGSYSFAQEGRSSRGRSGGRSGGSRPEGDSSLALKAGDQAILFKSVDENMKPVDMADMIKGKPLVLLTGSCT